MLQNLEETLLGTEDTEEPDTLCHQHEVKIHHFASPTGNHISETVGNTDKRNNEGSLKRCSASGLEKMRWCMVVRLFSRCDVDQRYND